jgi:hypothetical protein
MTETTQAKNPFAIKGFYGYPNSTTTSPAGGANPFAVSETAIFKDL